MRDVVKTALEAGGQEFATQVAKACDKYGEEQVSILPSGMAVVVGNGVATPIGCGTCVGTTLGQAPTGEPSLQGRTCRSAEEAGLPRDGIPMEIYANLWFCPNCGLPVSKTMPRFENKG